MTARMTPAMPFVSRRYIVGWAAVDHAMAQTRLMNVTLGLVGELVAVQTCRQRDRESHFRGQQAVPQASAPSAHDRRDRDTPKRLPAYVPCYQRYHLAGLS